MVSPDTLKPSSSTVSTGSSSEIVSSSTIGIERDSRMTNLRRGGGGGSSSSVLFPSAESYERLAFADLVELRSASKRLARIASLSACDARRANGMYLRGIDAISLLVRLFMHQSRYSV